MPTACNCYRYVHDPKYKNSRFDYKLRKPWASDPLAVYRTPRDYNFDVTTTVISRLATRSVRAIGIPGSKSMIPSHGTTFSTEHLPSLHSPGANMTEVSRRAFIARIRTVGLSAVRTCVDAFEIPHVVDVAIPRHSLARRPSRHPDLD
jgi:hypothetical protein